MTRGPIVLAIKHEKETKMADSPFQITCLARDYFQVINGGAVFAIRREPAAPIRPHSCSTVARLAWYLTCGSPAGAGSRPGLAGIGVEGDLRFIAGLAWGGTGGCQPDEQVVGDQRDGQVHHEQDGHRVGGLAPVQEVDVRQP